MYSHSNFLFLWLFQSFYLRLWSLSLMHKGCVSDGSGRTELHSVTCSLPFPQRSHSVSVGQKIAFMNHFSAFATWVQGWNVSCQIVQQMPLSVEPLCWLGFSFLFDYLFSRSDYQSYLLGLGLNLLSFLSISDTTCFSLCFHKLHEFHYRIIAFICLVDHCLWGLYLTCSLNSDVDRVRVHRSLVRWVSMWKTLI